MQQPHHSPRDPRSSTNTPPSPECASRAIALPLQEVAFQRSLGRLLGRCDLLGFDSVLDFDGVVAVYRSAVRQASPPADCSTA